MALIKNDSQSFLIKHLFLELSQLDKAKQMIGIFIMVVLYYIRLLTSEIYR